MESHKAMAEEDVAKIAAASTAAADKIHNLLSASDVDTLKHQQLLMYCFCIPLSSFCHGILVRLLHFGLSFMVDRIRADSEGCKTATRCCLISMIFRSVASLQWRTTSPRTHAFSSP
jgi:hypothetical protein